MRSQKRKQIKDANNEAEHEELSSMDNSFVKDPEYFNIFECVNNILNKIDATREWACMATPRDRYYRRVPDQDLPFGLIIWYIAKTIPTFLE